MKSYINKIIGCFLIGCIAISFTACSDDDKDNTLLKNSCLKRTLGPNVVGEEIYFAYAMAVPYNSGKILSATVEASIAGAEGTWLEHNSYHTKEGEDIPVLVGNPSTTENKLTKVEFAVDTCAATLRFYYKIPEEARGKSVTFTFTAEASTGERISTKMGPYQIAKMEMKRNIKIVRGPGAGENNYYISIEDMTAYPEATAILNPDKIDLVYLRRNYAEFGHTFVAPAAYPSEYFDTMVIPENLYRNTKIRKEWGIIDSHLVAGTDEIGYGTYIDDLDFETLDLSNMPNYAVNLQKLGGMWVETHDGKYRAFIFVNDLANTTGATLSMKRYTMK